MRSLLPGRAELVVALASALVASTILGAVAAEAGRWRARAVAAEELRRAEVVLLPVLVRSVGLGGVITRDDVGLRPFLRALVPDPVVDEAEALVGRTALEPILAGELVRTERLAPPGAEPGLQAVVSPGLRAMALDLQDEDRVSGFVTPGARVDVLATLDASDGEDAETVTLLEAVEILAVRERVYTNDQLERVRRPNVTVAVSPADAERLVALLPGEGQALKLALRGDADFTTGRAPPPTDGPPGRLSVAEARARLSPEELARMTAFLERTPLLLESTRRR